MRPSRHHAYDQNNALVCIIRFASFQPFRRPARESLQICSNIKGTYSLHMPQIICQVQLCIAAWARVRFTFDSTSRNRCIGIVVNLTNGWLIQSFRVFTQVYQFFLYFVEIKNTCIFQNSVEIGTMKTTVISMLRHNSFNRLSK